MPTAKLLEILVCPQCKEKLAQVEGGQGLFCKRCQLKYPVREGIPIMLAEEAVSLQGGSPQGAPAGTPTAPATRLASGGSTQVFQRAVQFKVIAGPDEGTLFELLLGQCRALGRAVVDQSKTTVMSVSGAISLDEEAKGLVLQYIAQQFRKPEPQKTAASGDLGAFKRGADVVFQDAALSRLHAMIFYDKIGVGILDLVSKNGTYINGEEVESRLLKKGDTIELGESKIVFEG